MSTPAETPFADPAGTWNRRFAEAGFLFGEAPNDWLREHAGIWSPGQRVLCVADGEGRNSVWLAGRGLVVDAFDISDVAVAKAREFAARQGLVVDAFDIAEIGVAKARRLAQEHGVGVNYTVSDCDAFSWPEAAYDGVAAIFVQFADPALRERLFGHMRRCLKPGGTLVLQGYTPRQLEYRTGGPPFESHLYTETLLREAFADLECVELREYEAELAEGSGHRGRSALIGLVARRRFPPSIA